MGGHPANRRRRAPTVRSGTLVAPRVGMFGLLGSGNLGNDASFEVVLRYLKAEHPDAVIDAMCMGPEYLTSQYGIPAIPMQCYRRPAERTSGATTAALKMLSKVIDAFRTMSWVRQHDAVIVPGMGVLEASLPLRATGVPYALFMLCASGKLFGTRVALVSVGANQINQRPTRWLFNWAARLAFYRSYRDDQSREAMQQRGLDISRDAVYPDLVFGLPAPARGTDDARTVGVGVMAYYGGNDDRRQAPNIHARYVETMTSFVAWLVDRGYRLQLFWGDNADGAVAADILSSVRADRPEMDPDTVAAEPFSSLRALMRDIAPLGAFVGTRYHNVLSALRLSKPTISVGYSGKFDALMADMGMSDFCLSARSLDLEELQERFSELERRSVEVREMLDERNATKIRDVEHQFATLSSVLFGDGEPGGLAEHGGAPTETVMSRNLDPTPYAEYVP